MSLKSKESKQVKTDLISAGQAVQIVANRLVAYEKQSSKLFDALEKKIGEYESFMCEQDDSKYDSLVTLIRQVSEQNITLSQRCDSLEKQQGIKPKKKGGTVNLEEAPLTFSSD
jgi:hypothetical protein